MRNTIIAALSFVLLLAVVVPYTAIADEPDEVYAEVTEQLDDALAEFDLGIGYDDISSLSFGELASVVSDRVEARLAAPIRLLSAIMLVIAAASVLRASAGSTLGGTSGSNYDMVCVTAAAAVTAPQLIDVYRSTVEEIELCGGFIIVFVPVFTAVSVMCGGAASAGVYHMLILGASELITELSESLLVPILGATTALSVTGSVFPDSALDSLVGLLKKALTWSITLVMGLFTGFVTLKCTIAGKADGVAVKAVKSLISGAVPIVGGAVSDAYATVKGSFEIIGSTVGAAGIIGIILLLLPKVLELFVYRGVMLLGAAAADMFGAPSVSKLLKSLDGGLAAAQCVLVCYSLMFVISSAILTQSIGQG